jgi:hypothetical protein
MERGKIWAELHMAVRERLGRDASPSAAVLDSQPIKSAEKGTRSGGLRRRQACEGPQDHELVDTEGLPMRSSSTRAECSIAAAQRWAALNNRA